MPFIRLIGSDENWEIDGDSAVPFDKLLFLAITCLECFLRTKCTLNVTLVELPCACAVLTATVGIGGGLPVNIRIFCILNVQPIMFPTDDFGA